MRIAQVSDFHFTHLTWNPFRLFPKRILANLNWLFIRKNLFCKEAITLLPDLLDDLKVDLVLLGGDLTSSSLPQEFKQAEALVSQFSQPWIAIPGNHDTYTCRSQSCQRFYQFFGLDKKRSRRSPLSKQISEPIDLFSLKKHGLELHPLFDSWWLITLDTTLATPFYSSEGLFSERTQSYLEEGLGALPPSAKIILFNHYPFFHNDAKKRHLIRGEALESLLRREPRIRLYLHGHTHRQILADLRPGQFPIVLDSGSCAHKTGASWNLIDLEEDHCTVSLYRFDKKNWNATHQETFVWE